MKNNSIYWIKVKTPSVLDEIFNSILISQYKKLSLIDYGIANSSVYDYNFDDDRSFWVQANGLSDVLSMLSTISVEFSTPILSFHDGVFAVFNSLGKKVELDDDVKTDFRKTCKVIEMQTGYFFDLEDDFDRDDEDLDDEKDDVLSDDEEFDDQNLDYEDDQLSEDEEDQDDDIEYQFNFSKNNLSDDEEDNSFEFEEEGGCGCENCQCGLGQESFGNGDKNSEEDEKTKEEIIKELFEIASQEEYDDNTSQEDISASNLSDTFTEVLNEEISNIENKENDKDDISDILKFFNDDSKKNNSKIEINEISLNEKFEPEINVVEIDINNESEDKQLSFEEFSLADCENEFDKLVNQVSKSEQEETVSEFGCNEEDCSSCSGTCYCSQVSDDYDEIDNFAADTFKLNNKEEDKEEYFQSQVDDFLIYEYEEPCCEDKLEYYTDNIELSGQKDEFDLRGEKDMQKELDKDIEGFKEIGFDEIEKALKEFFNVDNSLESVSDSTKDDVDKILKRIEALREQNSANAISTELEIDLKPIYESLKSGEVTLDIYTDESQKYIIEKLNGLLNDIETKKEDQVSELSDEDIFKAVEMIYPPQEEIVDNGEVIQLEEITASDLNLDTNESQNFYDNLDSFEWEKFEIEQEYDQFKNIEDVLDSKFGGYNQEVFSNVDNVESNFENIDDVMNSKFGGYQSPIASYGFVKNEDNNPIDTVLEQKFGFYSNDVENEVNPVFINNEISSNMDSVLDEKFGGYNLSKNEPEFVTKYQESKHEDDIVTNEDFHWNENQNDIDLEFDTVVEVEPTETNFNFYEDDNLFSSPVVNEDNVDSFDDSINDLKIEQDTEELTPYFESENLLDKFDQSVGEEYLVDLTVFDAPEEIASDNIEKIEQAFESSETLFSENDNPANMFDLEKENLYKNIYDDVVSNDNNLNDALKVNEDLNLSSNEISFETKPFEYEVLSKPKSEPKKTNIDELFKYDHSRIDLERIKANSESQRAIISGLSEFLKKIEIEKNKLQQKREEIEKKNQLAKQIINQGYDREKSFEFEKRNWR